MPHAVEHLNQDRGAEPARRRPATGLSAIALAAGGPALVYSLQRSAGNRAVGALLRRSRPLAVARCGAGGCTCGGACRHGDELEDEEHQRA